MTIELSLDDLVEVTENAQRFGACVFKTATSEGDPVWIAVQNPARATRARRARGAEAAAQQAAALAPPTNSGA